MSHGRLAVIFTLQRRIRPLLLFNHDVSCLLTYVLGESNFTKTTKTLTYVEGNVIMHQSMCKQSRIRIDGDGIAQDETKS